MWCCLHETGLFHLMWWSICHGCLSAVEVIFLMVWIPVSAVGILGWAWLKFFRTCGDIPGWLSVSAFPIKCVCSWGCGTYWRQRVSGPILLSYSFVWFLSFPPAFSCSVIFWLRPENPSPGFSGIEAMYSVFPIWKPFSWWKGTSGTGLMVLCRSEALIDQLLRSFLEKVSSLSLRIP